MIFSIIKALISGVIVSAVSEISKRSAAFGALVVSLPIISILSFTWVYLETKDVNRVADLSQATFWFVIPSLPFFFVLPYLLKAGLHYFAALALSVALTIILYFLMVMMLKKFGITL
ncbi:MAG: DUF3147 family protein [Pseudomonadota bacterium]